MKKTYALYFATWLFCLLGLNGVGQTLQPNYGAPATAVSVCDGNVIFKVKVIGSSSPCPLGTISISLPVGYVYSPGTAVVSAGHGTVAETTVGTSTATLTVSNIPASPDSTVISYQAYANCSAIGTATSTNSQVTYTLNSTCLGSYIVSSNTFNTQSAALTITNITNNSYNGLVGDAFTRAITITNNGLGNISQITLKDTSGNGFYIKSASVSTGWTIAIVKTVAGIDTINTFLLTGPQLQQGQSVVVTEAIKLVNKCYLQSNFNAYFGCNGSACTNNNVNATATAGATVNGSYAPNLKIISQTTALQCRGTQYAQVIKLANIGNAPLYKLSLNLFSSTWSAVPGTQYFNAARSYASGGQSAYQNIQYKLGINGTYTALPLDSTKSFTSPGAAIVGMPSSIYATIPSMNAGDTIYISYNELNSPLPTVNSGNTMEVSGGELWYGYNDGCGVTTAPVAVFVRNYVQTRINTLSTVPANMQQATTYQALYNFSESNSGVYIYTGTTGSTLRFALNLPANVSFSGNATDVSLTNAATGLPIAVASSFSYNAATNVVNVIYPITSTFSINGMLNGNFVVGGLTLNCAATSTGNNIVLNCYLKANSGCSNEEWMFSQTDKVNFVCPAACGLGGGMSFSNFTAIRTNYGLPDNDNNGVADGSGSINMAKVKTNYAMVGDTIQAAFYGTINAGTPATGFKYGYAVDTLSAYNTYLTSLYATIQIFAAGSSTLLYSCNNLPVSGGTTNTRKVDFSIPTLAALASCPLPGGYTQYNNGDSVVIKIYYRVNSNIGGTLGVVNIANKFYLGTVANPPTAQQYACGGNYTGNFTIVGNGFGSGTGNLTYSIVGITSAGTQGSNVAYMGPCCVTSGSKPFVYEYRSVSIYDSMSYTVPAGYDFVSATMSYNYTTGPSTSANKTVAITPVVAGANPLVFNLGSLFQSGILPYGDQGSSMTVTVNIKPNCAAQAKSTCRIYIRQIATPGSNSGLAPYADIFYDTVYLTSANVVASAANATVTTNTSTVSWDVQISNSSLATANNVWMAKDTNASGVTITSIQQLSGAGGSVVSTLTPTSGGIYQLGAFGQTSAYYRVNATYTSCVKDSIKLAYWYDCNGSGYPATVVAAPAKQDLQLSVIPQSAALQINIVSQPNFPPAVNFCDTLPYTLETFNAGPGSVTNMKVQALLPALGSISYTAGTFQFQYPAGTGTWVTIPDANVSVSGTTVTFSIPASNLASLSATQSYRIRFGLQTSCGFASGQSIWFSPVGTTACGQTSSGITQQSQKIQLAGVPATTNLYGITSQADSAAQACDNSSTITSKYTFKIVNQGPLPTSSSDWFSIKLPANWQLDTTSINYSHNPQGAAYDDLTSGVYNFRTGVGVAVGDSVVFTATLFVPAPVSASVPTGLTGLIKENAIVKFVGFCSSTGLPCPSGQVITSSNQSTGIMVANPVYTLSGLSVQQTNSKDLAILGTVSIHHADTLFINQKITLKLYKDYNSNGIIDAGDSLLGQQSIALSDLSNQTLPFNLSSPFSASFCPALIAQVSFGCYSLNYAYNCGTAAVYHSNAGSVKLIQHCDSSAFTIAAADLSGKWVLDSGSATVANQYLPNTAITINAGNAARLLWYSYPPGNTGSITIIPDTIRLINNSRPVISGLSNITACTGDPVSFVATVSVINASPAFQWMKNGALIGGANAATYLLSNSVQPSDAGLYKIIATGNNGCASADSLQLTVNTAPATPVPTLSASAICAGGTSVLSIQSPVSGINYYVYSDPGLTTAVGLLNSGSNSLSLAPASSSTYYIQAVNGTTGCKQTSAAVSFTLTVNPVPTVVITNPAAICAPGTIDITNSAVTAGSTAALIYGYYSDAAATSTLANPSAIATSGLYYIKGSTAAGCFVIKPVTVTINPKPALVITAPAPVCSPNTVDITAAAVTAGSSSGLLFSYFTDPAGTVSLSNPGSVAVSGTYYIKGSFASGCYDLKPVPVTINPLPVASITYAAASFCATGTTNPTQTGLTGGTYSSTAGLSINAGTGAINLAASTAGTYTVTYSFSNGTCNNTTTTSITINALPTAAISYAGSPYCATGTASVTQTGQTGGTYSSTAGLSINAGTGAINLAASTAGTYTVTYSFSNGTCNNTTTASITINALPTATISYAGSPYCATGTANVTQTGQAGGTYSSNAGLSINAATGNIDLAASTAGTYTVTYSFSNGSCNNTTTAAVTINALPTATISYAGSPYCATGTANVTQMGQAGGSYSSTAGLSINSSTGAIDLAISTPGTYTITYTFSNGTCNNTTTASITINALPTASISYAGSPYCATGMASVTQGGQAGGTYSSTAGLSINPSTGAVDLVASTPGTYTVTYSFSNGTCNNTTTGSITINALPTASISYAGSPYCATGTASVTQTGTPGGTYSSTSGLVIDAATGNIDLVASTAGTYTVTYSYSNGTCSNATSTSITINALPMASISYAGSPYCATGTATVTQTGQAGGTYSSTTGLSINAGTGDINLAASTAGTYTVTYSYSNGTCSNTTSTSVTINALPIATIAYTAVPYCATGTATVTQTGLTGGTYSSSAGLIINTSNGTVDLVASTPGTYTVTYHFSNVTCSNTTSTSITINALPTTTIAYAGSPYCATGTATVTLAGVAGGTYSSTPGLSINSSTGAIDLAASTPGTYTVNYLFSNGICSNTTSTLITVNALPVAGISYNASPYCTIGTAIVTQTGQAGGTYSSTAGLAINANTGTIDLASSTPGVYTITYNFSNGTCSNTTISSVTINALPTATISYAGSPYCATGTATVTQTGQAGGTYSSTAGLSINTSTGAVDLVASTAGTYTVTYSYSNGTCSNNSTANITINAMPVAAIGYLGTPYCGTGTATVYLTGQTGGTFSSSPGLALDPVSGNINLDNSTPGNYTVFYSFSNGSCSNMSATSLVINMQPIVWINDPPAICAPGTVNLTNPAITAGSTPGLSFLFYSDPAATNSLSNPSAIANPGTYYVTGTDAQHCVSAIRPIPVVINPQPQISTSGNSIVCLGNGTTISATAPGATLLWLGLGSNSSYPVTPTATTDYSVIATNAIGCQDTATVTITVQDFAATLTANPNPVLSGTTLTLEAGGNASFNVLSWLPLSAFPDQTANTQSFIIQDTAAYKVIVQSSEGCIDTASILISPEPNTQDFFIPNAFTPNGDGKNDVFKAYGLSIKDIDLLVFNQWGQLLFETKDPAKGWDGYYNGSPQPAGPYIYLVHVTLYSGKLFNKRGTFNLIR